ncbi:MAG: hypothetical protein MUO21_00935 [Nitrososphaeraceae archaeon]|nr:hypothetical protein [Nitrososphaeraceae archaeon]
MSYYEKYIAHNKGGSSSSSSDSHMERLFHQIKADSTNDNKQQIIKLASKLINDLVNE